MGEMRIDVFFTSDDKKKSLMRDVQHGLTSRPKTLPPKYFYDSVGSELFEQITELPEYYLTRTESQLLSSVARTTISRVRPEEVIELGSGSSTKAKVVLEPAYATGQLSSYIPFDVSESALTMAAEELTQEYPSLNVHGIVGDFETDLDKIPQPSGRRLLLLLGSTIGNLNADSRHTFLGAIRAILGPEDALLLGVDLVKSVDMLHAAYNDKLGITAAFNLNILTVLNRELGANFNPDEFQHYAFYNPSSARVEMHLIPYVKQIVVIESLRLSIEIQPNESIWTESSYKFTRESTVTMLETAGFSLKNWSTDSDEQVGLVLATPQRR